MQTNKKSTVLILLLAVSMISMIPALSIKPADAVQVIYPSTAPTIIQWYAPGGSPLGKNAYDTLAWNPEYLRLHTITKVPSMTTVIVQGKDAYGQNIEATIKLNGTCDKPIGVEKDFIFNDTHSGQPVAFAQITAVLQQNGTHNVQFEIWTEPEWSSAVHAGFLVPLEEYLGQYHTNEGGYLPGQNTIEYPPVGGNPDRYLVAHGSGVTCTRQDVPVEPSNPDPIKILINWHDMNGDLYPDLGELGSAAAPAWLWIEGLDQKGNKMETNVTIHTGDKIVEITHPLSGNATWSTICKMQGNYTDSYYILTEPMASRRLFYYNILINHMTIQPDCYDILANPGKINVSQVSGQTVWKYPGVTNVTVALMDIDGNLVHANASIVVNFATSGGKIQPSCNVFIDRCHITATANLTADTNARTVNVTADANVPWCTLCPAMNLFAWTEMTFDGINSVRTLTNTAIHTMMWGYHTYISGVGWQTPYTAPVPPKPVLPTWLGGPTATGLKLDGPIYEVMIPLYTGCNLISCPVYPILCNTYHSGYPGTFNYQTFGSNGIPMSLLFGNTSATTCIEVVWWYSAWTGWHSYVPGVDGCDSYFTDGVGYWIYAEKPCTLEISGVLMENAQFTPSVYQLFGRAWNLVGFTSTSGMPIKDYLESVNTGDPTYMSSAGPVWVYYAKDGRWVRNPWWGLWPGDAFWIYSKADDVRIAP